MLSEKILFQKSIMVFSPPSLTSRPVWQKAIKNTFFFRNPSLTYLSPFMPSCQTAKPAFYDIPGGSKKPMKIRAMVMGCSQAAFIHSSTNHQWPGLITFSQGGLIVACSLSFQTSLSSSPNLACWRRN